MINSGSKTCNGEENVKVKWSNLLGLRLRQKCTKLGFSDMDFFLINGQAVLQTA